MRDLDDLRDFRPVAAEISLPDEASPHRSGSLIIRWLVVFCLNLPVCLTLGSLSVKDLGVVGMWLGITTLFGLGWWIGHRSRVMGVTLIVGGWIVAFTQFLPIGQWIAGALGVKLAEAATGRGPFQSPSEPSLPGLAGGLIATLVTGGLLMTGAFFFGLIMRWITPRDWWGEAIPALSKGKKPIPDDLHDFQ